MNKNDMRNPTQGLAAVKYTFQDVLPHILMLFIQHALKSARTEDRDITRPSLMVQKRKRKEGGRYE